MTNEEKKKFYEKCGTILGIPHEWQPPAFRRTRWTNRNLGNGRFPEFGLVQCFNDTLFRVMSKHGTKMFDSPEAVYEYLKKVASDA